jgi:hypothetical protein
MASDSRFVVATAKAIFFDALFSLHLPLSSQTAFNDS